MTIFKTKPLDSIDRKTAPRPSIVTLPDINKPFPSILEFLKSRFEYVPGHIWRHRIECGKITDEFGTPITFKTRYTPNTRLMYFREVDHEPVIPFKETIIFQNDHLIASVKPHFLPVIPGGPYVNECLLYRLRQQTGMENLSPIHRIDRETAGIVLFSVNRETRGAYQLLFDTGQVEKTYEAIGGLPFTPTQTDWIIQGKIEKGTPWFRMHETSGAVNAKTVIHLLETRADQGRYRIHPQTGKKHQIRIHMCRICPGIKNDRYYPELQSESDPDFSKPLKLLAKEISFRDPLTKTSLTFRSTQNLSWE
ncbi:MAG: pseudouridine synthase [Proteobacteria bacterium]|nr:pseudouridine synthase [Pseudomonadota bacterium]